LYFQNKEETYHLCFHCYSLFCPETCPSTNGRHIDDCIPIFEHMKAHCVPNIGTIYTMFDDIKGFDRSATTTIPDDLQMSSMSRI
jgi:hypothetical protein